MFHTQKCLIDKFSKVAGYKNQYTQMYKKLCLYKLIVKNMKRKSLKHFHL